MIPDSVEIIGESAFHGLCCNDEEGILGEPGAPLREILFGPNSRLREIYGVRELAQLTMIYLPDSVEIIGDGAFCECGGTRPRHWTLHILISCNSSLVADRHEFGDQVDSPYRRALFCDVGPGISDVTAIKSKAVHEMMREDRLHYTTTADHVVRFPSYLRIIQRNWFDECISLRHVSFATACIREIDGFRKCRALDRIEIPPSVEVINGFKSCSALAELVFAPGGQVREINGFSKSQFVSTLDLPATVEIVNGFKKFVFLKIVAFAPDGCLREIGGFSGCKSLCYIDIPPSVELLKGDAFKGCTALQQVTFARYGRLRELAGFRKCESLIGIEIPANVEIIREESFKKCGSLRDLFFAPGSRLRDLGGFNFCSSLSRIDFPVSLETLRDGCFRACSRLRMVTFPPDTQIREVRGFRDCVLTLFGLPGTVVLRSVSYRAFLNFTDERYMKNNRRRVHLQTHDSISPLGIGRPFGVPTGFPPTALFATPPIMANAQPRRTWG
jgi:hypothetical protein